MDGYETSPGSDIILLLHDLIGKTVTVFINGGGPSGAGFYGVILSVHADYIKLLQETTRRRIVRQVRNPVRRLMNKIRHKSCNVYYFDVVRSIVDIKISKIIAVNYNNSAPVAVVPRNFRNAPCMRSRVKIKSFLALVAVLILTRLSACKITMLRLPPFNK